MCLGQKPPQTGTRFVWIGFLMCVRGFSVPQMRKGAPILVPFLQHSYDFRSNAVIFPSVIFPSTHAFIGSHAHSVPG